MSSSGSSWQITSTSPMAVAVQLLLMISLISFSGPPSFWAPPLVFAEAQGIRCLNPVSKFETCNNTAASALCLSTGAQDGATACYGCGAGTGSLTCNPNHGRSFDRLSQVQICGKADQKLECPSSHPALVGMCGSRTSPCNRTAASNCAHFGITCAQNFTAIPTADYSCDWVPFNNASIAECDYATEVASGVCFSPTQSGCGGTPYGGAVKCCLVRQPSCTEPTYWYRRGLGDCPATTAMNGACSVRCDPLGLFGYVNNNPGMFACNGRVYTRNTSTWISECLQNPSCPSGMILVGFSQCMSFVFGAGTEIHCETPRYSVVEQNDCVELSGNDNLWCPQNYYGVSLCAPNSPGGCSGLDTRMRCCRVRQFHNMGEKCTPNQVYTVAGNAPITAPYGLDQVESLGITAIGSPTSVAWCRGRLYAAVDQGAIINLDFNTDRANVSLGQFGTNGYSNPSWSPPSWDSRSALLNKPNDVATMICTSSSEKLAVVDSGNFIVRTLQQFVPTLLSPTNFLSETLAGVNQTSGSVMVNNSDVDKAKLNVINSAVYRSTTQEVLISTDAAILNVDQTSRKVRYYVGNGVTRGGLVQNAFRTNSQVYYPYQLALLDEVIAYAADYDGSGPTGLIHTIDMSTGKVYLLNAIPVGTVPRGIVIYQRTTMFVSDAGRHCLWRIDLTTLTSSHFAGICGSPGLMDNVDVKLAQFNSPRFLAVSESTLFIADFNNLRVRAVVVANTACGEGYTGLGACTTCSSGFSGFPRCRRLCMISADCSYNAWNVSGIPGACTCQCNTGYTGANCGYCTRGRDLNAKCQSCLPGFTSYPGCRTESESISLDPSSTMTGLQTETITITPPPTATRTLILTLTAPETFSPTGSSSLTETFELSKTVQLTPTWEKTVTPQSTETFTFTERVTESFSDSLLPTPSTEITLSTTVLMTLTSEVSISSSLLPTTTLTMSLSASETLRVTGTVTWSLQRTPTETNSWPLKPSVVTLDPADSLSPSAQYSTRSQTQPLVVPFVRADIFHKFTAFDREISFRSDFGDWDYEEVIRPFATPPEQYAALAEKCVARFWSANAALNRIFLLQNITVQQLGTTSHFRFVLPRSQDYPLYADPSELVMTRW